MTAVQFNQVPAGGQIRVPFWWGEIRGHQTPYQDLNRLLLLGHKTNAGSVALNTPTILTGGLQSSNATALCGAGSMLEQELLYARRAAPFQEIWFVAVAEPAGSAAAGRIDCVAPSSSVGAVIFYIQGQRLAVSAVASDTGATLATKVAAAINAASGLQCTAAVNGSVNTRVDVTARHVGVLGNDIRIELGLVGDEGPLAASLLTVTQMSGGSGTADVTAALAACGQQLFDYVAGPFSDVTNLNVVQSFLDGISGRWSPYQQLYGHYVSAKNSNLSTLASLGTGRNDPHVSVLGYLNSPSPSWLWAATAGAVAASHLAAPPELSRPLQTLVLPGILPPAALSDRFSTTDRNTLYFDGIGSYMVNPDGTVSIDRLITTYQKNIWGSPDASFLDIETLAQAVFFMRYMRAKVTGTYGRAALVDKNPTGLQGFATPEDVADVFKHGYKELVALGVVENYETFAQNLIVVRNQVDANRLDNYLPADTVNQLRIMAVVAEMFLQYDQP